ncbi:MAG: redoxin domain-containing protein [Acidimicrobiia bacterium]|nr:redoxin domain-containing protein [Acidimicrobiia bacterium]
MQTEDTTEAPDPAEPTQSFAGTSPAPDFPAGLDWLNTGEPISLTSLQGKVVLLDFWTYGCINCIHIIPDLKRLEAEYPNELVVIGVHSAKFLNEGATDNIRNVVLRYGVEHPVVNDRDFEVWQTWGANAWPTTVLIDPAGNVVGGHSGEGVYEVVQPVVQSLVDEFEALGTLDRTPLEFALEKDGLPDTILSFPGKVFIDPSTELLYIADTANHRIVAADPTSGEVIAVYGRGEAGYTDGAALEARFDSPQGMALSPDGRILYVADTNNHAVRSINLTTSEVGTAAGTGDQGWPPATGLATQVRLASPWALEQSDGVLYIAMAGTHQIWSLDLASDVVGPLVGNARESTVNGPLAQAELAQPSGLAIDGEGVLYFADSESSSIRSAEVLKSDGVTDVIAGSDANLFDFGDVDGIGTEARLQHPLGLALAEDGFLYVADTYNSKIKRIDLDRREITTYLGNEQGWQDGPDALFYEPGGISTLGNALYVADTNNHSIRVVDLATGTAETLILKGIERFQPPPDNENYRGVIVETNPVTVATGAASIEINITLPPDHKVNEDAPSSAEFFASGVGADFGKSQGISLTGAQFPVTVPVEFDAGQGELTADLTVIYCREGSESLCLIQQLRFIVPIVVEDGGEAAVLLEYEIVPPEI